MDNWTKTNKKFLAFIEGHITAALMFKDLPLTETRSKEKGG